MSDEVRKVSRRSFLGRVLGGAVVGTVAIIATAEPAEAQYTDSDPYDPVGRGRGRGITDRDPYDPVGRGRGWRGRRRRRRGWTGITDRDPYDPVGNGRGRRRRRICTDRDPYDPVNRGRWCRR